MARTSNLTVKIEGLREFQALVAESETMLETELAVALLDVGEHVAKDVQRLYSPYSAVGAEGVKAKLSGGQIWTGKVIVAQTLSKSRSMTRRRSNFGPLMMGKAFLPAQDANQGFVTRRGEEVLAGLQAKWELEGV